MSDHPFFDTDYGQAVRWVMQYCTWGPPGDPEVDKVLPRTFAGRISHHSFCVLHVAVITADCEKTLPTLKVTKDTFKGMAGGKRALKKSADELARAGLIEVDSPRNGASVWTLCVGTEART